MGCSVAVEDAGFSTVPCEYCEMAREDRGEEFCWPTCNGTREVSDHREVHCSYSTLMRILRQLGPKWNSQYDDIAENAFCSFSVECLPELEADLVRSANRLAQNPMAVIPEDYSGFLNQEQGNLRFTTAFLDVVQYALIHKKAIHWA